MWHQQYQNRLSDWVSLRQRCQSNAKDLALESINQWWQQTPWRAYYLHWDDKDTWPDPWQLLADNCFCDLARALGIVYTIALLEREDLADIEICQTDQGNLVLVDQGKYILNWSTGLIVNIASEKINITKRVNPVAIPHLTGYRDDTDTSTKKRR